MRIHRYAISALFCSSTMMIRHTSAFLSATLKSRRIVTTPSASSHHHYHRSSSSTFWTSPFTLFSASSSTTTDEEIDPGIVPGTNLRVLKYPHPALRAPNTLIDMSELTGPGCEISQLVKEMFLVLYASHGCGLAAPQVGINRRLMVYNESGDPKDWMGETVMINPRIIEYSTGTDIEEEGCLSFPKIRARVVRPKWIKIEAMNLKGKKFKKKFVGWEARIFQHEYDHLDGTVFIDRLSEDIRKEAQPTLDGLIASYGEGGAL